jgi:hypothetical protein
LENIAAAEATTLAVSQRVFHCRATAPANAASETRQSIAVIDSIRW